MLTNSPLASPQRSCLGKHRDTTSPSLHESTQKLQEPGAARNNCGQKSETTTGGDNDPHLLHAGEHLGLGSQTKLWEKAQQLLFAGKCSCHHSPVQSWPVPHEQHTRAWWNITCKQLLLLYKVISTHSCSLHAHRVYYPLSICKTWGFLFSVITLPAEPLVLFFSYPCWDVLKKKLLSAKLFSMAHPPDCPAPSHKSQLFSQIHLVPKNSVYLHKKHVVPAVSWPLC